MAKFRYYENHPGVFREHPNGDVDMLRDGKWKPAGSVGKSLLFKKRFVTGDLTQLTETQASTLMAHGVAVARGRIT